MKISRKKVYKKIILAKKSRLNKQIKEFKKAIKNISLNDIISIDETSIDTHIHSSYGWSDKGKKIIIEKNNSRIRYTLTCAISYGHIFENQIIKNSANAITFQSFIKNIVDKLPKNKVTYILLDNARIHHAKIIQSYIKRLQHVRFIYNVPYSPEYNPIEKVLNELKILIKKKHITNTNIIGTIQTALMGIKKENIINYYIKSLSGT